MAHESLFGDLGKVKQLKALSLSQIILLFAEDTFPSPDMRGKSQEIQDRLKKSTENQKVSHKSFITNYLIRFEHSPYPNLAQML